MKTIIIILLLSHCGKVNEWFQFIEIKARKSSFEMNEPHHQMRIGRILYNILHL